MINLLKSFGDYILLMVLYVVFLDEELRKKYDLYGEDGLKNDHFGGGHYQSWNYFNEEFGEFGVIFYI